MTISSTIRRNDYDGNGSTNIYAYTFKIFASSHIRVTVRNDTTLVETVLTETTHYTVSSVGETAGGNVTLVAGSFDWLDGSNYLDTGYSLALRLVPPINQLTDIRNQGPYYPELHENQFDKIIQICLYIADEVDRSLKLQETSEQTGITVPDVQADKFIAGKTDASGFEWRAITATSGTFPGDFSAGLDASKAAVPSTNDVYVATDTKRYYICFASGTWTAIQLQSGLDASKNAAPLAGEVYVATDTGKIYICLSAGTWINKVVGIFDGLKGADIASATTTDIGAATGNYVDITGTTTITGLGTADAGVTRDVQFDGILTLTHNGTSLILPSGANITTAAGDTARFVSLGSGNWKCLNYVKADGSALVDSDTEVKVVQVVNTDKTSYQAIDGSSGTSIIPSDDTIPAANEGDVVLTRTITPTSGNLLDIRITICMGETTGPTEYIGVSLCLDGGAAIAAWPVYLTSIGVTTVSMQHYYTTVSGSEHSFTVRVGPDSTAVVYINGDGGARIYGGVCTSSITITEIAA